MKTFAQDLRFAVRTFSRGPAFALAILASLAIGIGANTVLFSVTHALLLSPLPYADADRLAILWNRSPGLNIEEDWFSTAQYFDVKTHSGFEQVAIAYGDNQNLTGDGDPERVSVARVSSTLLPMLGAEAARGRLFVTEEDAEGSARTAILMHGTWQRRYGGDPQMVGKKLILNGQPFEVVGILPARFTLPREVMPTLYAGEQIEVLLPLPLSASASTVRTGEDYNILAKLKPGVSVAQAQAEMDTITARLRRDFPDVYPPNGGLTFSIVPLLEQVVGNVRQAVLILLGAVGFVLLIACANVANLLLSRAVVRRKEIAIRQAVGAERSRIVRQLMTESVLLAMCGGALGVLLAVSGLQLLHVLGPKSVPRLAEIGINVEALLFTVGVSIFSGLLFGLAPALRLSRLDLRESLNDTTRGLGGISAVWSRGNRLRKLLVVSQLALSVMLLIGAGLLVRSFARLQDVNPGFNPRNVLTVGLTMTGQKYRERPALLETYRRLWEEIQQLPGVTAAGGCSFLPLSEMFGWGPITVEGRVSQPGEQFINADMRMVGGKYFEAMQIPLLRGRLFNEHDTPDNPRVSVIDEYMAQQLWPGQDPIGKRFRIGGASSTSPWITVVGIVGRVKQYTLDADSRIALHLPHAQFPRREMFLALRGDVEPAALAASVRLAIAKLDPDLPLYSVQTMEQRHAQSLARRRFSMVLLGTFAGIALLLAALGVYGTMAYLVNQGMKEIGIRMALGATRGGILSLVVRHAMTLALLGVAVGLAGAFVLTRVMQSLLYGVRPHDGITFGAIPFILLAVALAASLIPARRASQIDPMVSLRWE